MSSPKLGNYLRTYRIRAGLTQRDVAVLLGLEAASTISRTEKGKRIPSVHFLLGYSVLFKIPPEDLVPGICRDMEKAILDRTRFLTEKLRKRRATSMVLKRIKFLEKQSQPHGETDAIRRHEQFKKSGISQAGACH